jgi:hypothetical protein
VGRSRSKPPPDRLIAAPAAQQLFLLDADCGSRELPFPSRAFNASLQMNIRQPSNRTSGAAMKFLNQSNEKNHPSVSRNTRRHSLRPVSHPERTGFSKIEPGLTRDKTASFVEDFNLEHSFSGVSITLLAISASSDFVESGTIGDPSAYDLHSPNCVYIG